MRFPLFVTRQSLSPRSAIGVQTMFLMEDFPQAKHIFWSGFEVRSMDSRSAQMESMLFARLAFFKKESSLNKHLSEIGFSWWIQDKPSKAAITWLVRRYKDTVSTVYLAPLDGKDARRMQALVLALGRPFVLHLWDLLDLRQNEFEAMSWLIEHAEHIFCLSEAISEHINRENTSILCFTRKPSIDFAQPPSAGEPLRLVLIGDCGSYRDGLVILNDALKLVQARGHQINLTYIGRQKALDGWGSQIQHPIEVTGFVLSNDDRDRLLAKAHIGILPGPFPPPEDNTRSRFSIPSRILDFLAVGLPVAGPVHSRSATARYMIKMGLDPNSYSPSPELLAERLLALTNPKVWQTQAGLSREGFLKAQAEPNNLKIWLRTT